MNAHRSGPLSLANGVCARFDDQSQPNWSEKNNNGENHVSQRAMGSRRNRNRLAHFSDRDIRNAFFQVSLKQTRIHCTDQKLSFSFSSPIAQGQWTASIAWRLQMSAEAFRQSYEQSPRRTRFELRLERSERNPVGERVRDAQATAERPQGTNTPHIAQRYPAREEVTADSGDKNKNEEASVRREKKPETSHEKPCAHVMSRSYADDDSFLFLRRIFMN